MSDGRMLIVLDLPEVESPDLWEGTIRAVRDIVSEDIRDQTVIRLAIREVADEVIAVFERAEEKEMGFVKHGTGEVLPENEQQKQGSKDGLSQEDVDAIVAEGKAEGDGDRD